MTSPDEELDRMEAALLAAVDDPEFAATLPQWTTAEDLSRIGIESMRDRDPIGRTLGSEGSIRISGDGVTGSAARVTEVARVMTGLQRLATAVGAAQTGDKALGRKPNADIKRRTELLLTTAPAPGSIILSFMPAVAPADEAGPAGMLDQFETDDQMLDAAVGAAIDVFTAGNDIGPEPEQSAFVHRLGDMGPRTASAVRDLAKTLDRADFDVDIDWKQPSRATRRVSVTARAARHMAYVVEHANLDEQPVIITGEYLTVSAVSSWVIQQDDGDPVTVKLGRVDPSQTRGLAVGERIRVQAIMKTETTPGGNTKTTYTAQSFERLDHPE
ncbi:hypothetical protein [Mycolicibacterium llatzerense]|uniref:hypothetical protein n=1 Tax=Mycolicibacterium llatzerense TaxID=280871 RepID=UPI0021B5526F|nr:hypothetical protein [Mycolicibacterium llatzerense]